MRTFLRTLISEWTSAESSKRLGIVADLTSIFGVSFGTVLGVVAVQAFRPGRVDWGGASVVAAGFAFYLAIALAIHGVFTFYAKEFGATEGLPKVILRLIQIAYWVFLFGICVSLMPDVIRSIVLIPQN